MVGRHRIRISTANVHPAVRIGLIALVESDTRRGGIGQAQDDREAIASIALQLAPFLSSLSQPSQQGSAPDVQATLAILHYPRGQQSYVHELVDADPALIPLLRDATAPAVVSEVPGMLPPAPGETGGCSSTETASQPAALIEPLSQRELEVLRLLAAGLSNKDLAARLFLSVGTVKQHLHHINGKLGTTSRTSALARARHLGIL